MNCLSRVAVVLGCSLVFGCASAPANVHRDAAAELPEDLSLLLPAAPPSGFLPAMDVTRRTTEDIFEQINGGSYSFLENGMTHALFALYPLKGAEEGTEIAFEVYRFKTHAGAKVQFRNLHGDDGIDWNQTHAVIHEYGIELVSDRLIIRSTFNDGPEKQMIRASKFLAKHVLGQVRPRSN